VEQRTTNFNIGADQARQSILMLGGQKGGGANSTWCRRNAGSPSTGGSSRGDRREEKGDDWVLESCSREGIPLEWEDIAGGHLPPCREAEPLGGSPGAQHTSGYG